ncbi:hypothetical protein DM02DRAFT_340042 [Periconia macrospinosa]|uniref:Uncharacterized protein n=1 Tax=Periconia macrospinosa TaxID=97972 RepID=A0A2V1D0H5_9PLEO|nr:hypothetical protein DM02DRAFT_340042 [Periconia macrospinosa]
MDFICLRKEEWRTKRRRLLITADQIHSPKRTVIRRDLTSEKEATKIHAPLFNPPRLAARF